MMLRWAFQIGSPPRVWGNRCMPASYERIRRFTPTRVGKSAETRHVRSRPLGSPPRVWGNRLPGWFDTELRLAVHPHACGEIAQPGACSDAARFTPTRVGKSTLLRRMSRTQSRFTPTRVGKSQSLPDVRCLYSGSPPRVWGNRRCAADAHGACGSPPRVWGNRRVSACELAEPGSPPRVWGNRSAPDCAVCCDCRFTPTRVGKSCSDAIRLARIGSPPRVWGNRLDVHGDGDAVRFTPTRVGKSATLSITAVAQVRFTPTRVGKSRLLDRWQHHRPVHPHACGEIDSLTPRSARHRRFTPTRVGKTRCGHTPTAICAAVHPHACGEICWHHCRHWRRHAVHPHACGENVTGDRACMTPCRSTPTRVGKTACADVGLARRAVHPHACGEIAVGAPSLSIVHGSPPRVWGNHRYAPGSSLCVSGSPPRVWGNLAH